MWQGTKNLTKSALEGIWRDLRHTVRNLRRSPAFTATVVLTLALGIGATTAIFTLIQQVMLRSLPVARPDQLWRIGDAVLCCHSNGYNQGDENAENNWSFFSWEAYNFFRANTPAFEDLAAFQLGGPMMTLRRPGSPAPVEKLDGEYVSGNFFRTFGISPWRGRLFTDADDLEGAPLVAVMSFRTWEAKYGSDPSVIGAAYQINGDSVTIIGIAPPGFFGAKVDSGGMPDLWLPLTMELRMSGATSRLKTPNVAWLDLIGRVRPGVNPRALETQLRSELHQWLAGHVPDMLPQEKPFWEKQTLHLTPAGAGVSLMRKKYQDGLLLLLLAALCVLLVACANIANLLLARGLKDRPKTAVHVALGASRARLVRKALTESLTLAVVGAVAGIAVAYAGAGLILRLAFTGQDTWAPLDAAPSTLVLLFALGISVMAGVIFGIAPAWAASHAQPIEALRGSNRSTGGSRGTVGAQKMLVIMQAAVSLVLLSAAAMLGQSLRNLEKQDFGFDTKDRYLVSAEAAPSDYRQDQLLPLFRAMEDSLHTIPGVRMVSSSLYAPLTGYDWGHEIRIEGRPEPGPHDDLWSDWVRVTPGFFETMGDRIVRGRPITDQDNANTRRVAVINQAFAKQFFGRENPIGQHFGPAPQKNAGTYEIIGVASDMRYFASRPAEPMYFLPEAQTAQFTETDLESREIWSHYPRHMVIWAPGNPSDLDVQVRRALANAVPNLGVDSIQPYSEIIHADFAQQNMIASLTWLFGALGLVLAAVGLYGVTAYGVEHRTNEIGVRMSLGADRSSVVALVLRGAFSQVGLGLVLGIPAAIGAGYLITRHLFGVKPWDPLMLSLATLLLGFAALIAAVIPARHAASVNPVQALRAE